MAINTTRFDASEYLETPEDIAAFIEASMEDDPTPAELAHAMGTVARAIGMSELARKTGLSREALYKALSEDGNPRLSTLMAVFKALGLRLAALPRVSSDAASQAKAAA